MEGCFGYINKKCAILKSRKCEGFECSFYKSKEKYQQDQEKAMDRVLSLDQENLEYINMRYYDGLLEV
jgi:hypothetical protein